MTDQEQRAWVSMLGPTRQRQILTIRDLLRHANSDDMSRHDRTICLTQLRRLEEEQYGQQVSRHHRQSDTRWTPQDQRRPDASSHA